MKKIWLVFCLVLFFSISFQINAQWFQQTSGTAEFLNSVHFSNLEVGWIVGNNGTLIKTTNGGENWVPQTSGTNEDLLSIYFIDPDNGWCVGSHGIIIHTTNGGINWAIQNSGTNNDLNAVRFINKDTGTVVGSSGIILQTNNGGDTWINQYIQPGYNFYSVSFANYNIGWLGGGATILKTTNGGVDWIQQFHNTSLGVNSIFCLDTLAVLAISFYFTFPPPVARAYYLKTVDGGLNWMFNLVMEDLEPKSVYFTNYNNGWIAGRGYENGHILKTSDAGLNWYLQYTVNSVFLYSIFFRDSITGWVVGENGTILKTINGGIPVELISFSSSVSENNVILNWQTATETNNQGFQIEKRKMQDEGSEEWNVVSFVNGNGTTTEPQSYIFVDENLSAGKYQYRLKQVDYDGTFEYSNTIEIEIGIPAKFSLQQNYPNPFNPSTTISYQIPKTANVTIKAFDILGREVATLVNEEKPAGSYKVEFNSASSIKNPASGIYFYQLKSGEFVDTKKMILLK